ncbi:hypothetical protein [Actinoplanes sp. G11-F43]|uniref:hypothetical protein n=1 Tax=Actinoplanes sp. G11-F43 TaxID=3424130 RepID=UPI003D33DF6B
MTGGKIVGAAALTVALLSACTSAAGEPETPELEFVAPVPAATPAESFGAGSYVVGRDVALGRYSAGDAVASCRWIQRDGSGAVLDRDGVDRPTQVLTLSAPDTELVVDGPGCTFARLP